MRPSAAWLLVALIVIVTVARIASTHHVFSPTWDEPAHILAGYEYLVDQRYTFDGSHPPLARAVFAFPLRDAGAIGHDVRKRIGDVLTSRGELIAGVAAARRGNLLFVVIALVALAVFAADLFGTRIAVLATALFALLPPILAHGAVATTDIPLTASVAAALAVLNRWIRTPDWRHTAALSLAIGAGLLTKFSFPMVFGLIAVCMLAAAHQWPIRQALLASFGGLAIVWIAYRFQLARFLKGFIGVMRHNAAGHDAYFMGEVRATGWWEYFPVILGIKTPIPFMLLAAAGGYFVLHERRNRVLLVMAALMLALVMSSRINLGVRHILPIYIPLSIVAAVGVDRLWTTRARALAVVLPLWLAVNSISAHPDYLPWMNILAGKQPERVALDSNFDWGQDVLRLRNVCREMQIGSLGVALFGSVDLERIGMPPTHAIPRQEGGPGWYAVSEGFIIPEQVRDPSAYEWLTEGRSFRRIGKTIRLYQVQ